ncbi:Uncharacterised protein [BD1-7 clade bacterium]|uniref:Methylase n=1 Tax=BD1-7 clade bacterium TaxID=2029982 RepID=A0A5S9QFW1_9GAMM|nr:Uncharacterised protein [BD1-7 clade bacterium]
MTEKPIAPACERNRDPILDTIKPLLADCLSVLEVGSGTGQHAVYFSAQMPDLCWHTSDLAENLPGINAWVNDADLANLPEPVELDVMAHWPALQVDAIFTANTLHIMGESAVQAFFEGLPKVMNAGARVIIYGPFNYNGEYTSASNAEFDGWLKARNPSSGIRAIEWISELAARADLVLTGDHTMPANNRLLVFQHTT